MLEPLSAELPSPSLPLQNLAQGDREEKENPSFLAHVI